MDLNQDHFSLLLLFGSLPVASLVVFLVSRVTKKAGYSGWWALIMLVPLVNIVAMWVFAFSNWPNADVENERFEDL